MTLVGLGKTTGRLSVPRRECYATLTGDKDWSGLVSAVSLKKNSYTAYRECSDIGEQYFLVNQGLMPVLQLPCLIQIDFSELLESCLCIYRF